MRTPVKVAAWAAVFLACAGTGAFIAAHTNPFPPGVDRPSGEAIVSITPSPSSAPTVQRWVGVVRTVARHDFYVGGACQTRWRTIVRFHATPPGEISGTAVGRVVGRERCDFPQAQVQTRTIRSPITGWYSSSGVIGLVFRHPIVDPIGSSDLGGYLEFLRLPRLASQTTDGKLADQAIDKQLGDGDRGTYRFVGSVSLRCLSGCQPPSGA
jgi:hypothetical protein